MFITDQIEGAALSRVRHDFAHKSSKCVQGGEPQSSTPNHAGLPLFGGLVQLDVDAVRVFDKDAPSTWRRPNDFAAGGHDWRLGSADRLQQAIKILDTER